ncbi:SUMF1/EgtB/PvdO family nonheme iron enzyme [bacterium]|nr:SUMF1/EgtB/PvdO family nonheme iron enzyme [bacterium]
MKIIACIVLSFFLFGSAWAQEEDEVLTPVPMPADLITPDGMAYIPGGVFNMGREGSNDASPVHVVEVSAFYMDVHEVTCAEYKVFCDSTGHRLPEFWGSEKYHCGEDYPDHAVVGVSRNDAAMYAKWAGKRIPSEAEWEFAARGGSKDWVYPCGAEMEEHQANFRKKSGLQAVKLYEPNGYGLYDMGGNVWEWVGDYYDPNYYSESPRENPRGPESGSLVVIRGGGWYSGPGCLRVDGRGALSPGWVDFAVGFRCARNIVVEE